MKKYIAPELEVTAFCAEDIITTSGGGSTPTPSPSTWTVNSASNPAEYSGTLVDFQ